MTNKETEELDLLRIGSIVEAYRHIEENEDPVFSHMDIVLSNATTFVSLRIFEQISLDAKIQGRLIPPQEIFPKFAERQFSVAASPSSDGVYIKRPKLIGYFNTGGEHVRQTILKECSICEILKKDPHPNIVEYLGISHDGLRITGICFKKYKETLFERARRRDTILDVENCVRGIQSALDHLHKLGICHNDINPGNIMFGTEDGTEDVPVIIDFDSSEFEGRPLGPKGGTFGWCIQGATLSTRENDSFGVSKIKAFLEGNFKYGL